MDVEIQHAHYTETPANRGDEYRPDCVKGSVDGFHEESNTIYEFLGDYYHGHPDYWDKEENHFGNKFEVLFEKTKEKLQTLYENGYNVRYIWESDFKGYKKGLHDILYREYEGELEFNQLY